MTEFPPPQAESKDGWWKRRSSLTKGLLIVGALVLGIGAVGSALDPAEDEAADAPAPVETDAPEVTDPAPETTEAPVVTEPEPEVTEPEPEPTEPALVADEFQAWLIGQLPIIMANADDMQSISPMMDAGDIEGAAAMSTEVGETFTDLYLRAPETGTELSDITNEMLLTCSVAYTMAGAALDEMDIPSLEDATDGINDCSDLLIRSTELMEP